MLESTSSRWWYALKPASWPKLLVPCVLGQALGLAASTAGGSMPSWLGLLVGLGFTLFDIGFIVLLNDWGDREVDAIKRRMFPKAGSPKTIPDGILSARQVLLGGLGSGLLAALCCALGQVLLNRPYLGLAGGVALSLFLAYTLPPLKLNYRGGGELLEMLGVGVLLPWLNAYAQSGQLFDNSYWLLLGFAFLSLSSALASGLSDERSDRAGGKRTLASVAGNGVTRRVVEVSSLVGLLVWLGVGFGLGAAWLVLPGVLVAALHWVRLRRLSAAATTDAFAAQGLYKSELHHCIWRGAGLLALMLALRPLIGS